jgi:Helix-turn-helix domain
MTELLSPTETTRRLHVTYGTLAVWRCTHRKALPFVRIGRKIFYREEDIENFILANLHPGDGPRPEERKRLGR